MEKKYLNRNYIPFSRLSLVKDKTVGLTTIRYTPVKIEVIEKFPKGEKVLIDGKLYVTELPVDLEIGEIVAGKIIKNNPLTVSLDIKKENNERQIDKLLKILGIKKNPLTTETVNLLLVLQKPLVKSFVEELITFLRMNNSNYSLDELKVLTHLIWNSNKLNTAKVLDRFIKIFDQSFESISEKIFELLNEYKIENGFSRFTQALWSYLVCNNAEELSGKLKNKDNNLIEILELLEDEQQRKSIGEEQLTGSIAKYLEKYLLQKSYFALTGIYKDFIVLSNGRGYKFYYVKYEAEKDTQVYNLFITTDNKENKLIGYLTENIIYGELHSVGDPLEGKFITETFNEKINADMHLKSFLRFKSFKKKNMRKIFDNYKSVVNYS